MRPTCGGGEQTQLVGWHRPAQCCGRTPASAAAGLGKHMQFVGWQLPRQPLLGRAHNERFSGWCCRSSSRCCAWPVMAIKSRRPDAYRDPEMFAGRVGVAADGWSTRRLNPPCASSRQSSPRGPLRDVGIWHLSGALSAAGARVPWLLPAPPSARDSPAWTVADEAPPLLPRDCGAERPPVLGDCLLGGETATVFVAQCCWKTVQFSRFSNGSQVSSLGPYPSHRTLNSVSPWRARSPTMASTS